MILNGFRYGIVGSLSMVDYGLKVGDIVRTEKDDSYELDDVILFYRSPNFYPKLRE